MTVYMLIDNFGYHALFVYKISAKVEKEVTIDLQKIIVNSTTREEV